VVRQALVYDRPEGIGAYLGKTDLDSVESMSKRVAALERQLKKLASVALSG
jgi:hypothetical protein